MNLGRFTFSLILIASLTRGLERKSKQTHKWADKQTFTFFFPCMLETWDSLWYQEDQWSIDHIINVSLLIKGLAS